MMARKSIRLTLKCNNEYNDVDRKRMKNQTAYGKMIRKQIFVLRSHKNDKLYLVATRVDAFLFTFLQFHCEVLQISLKQLIQRDLLALKNTCKNRKQFPRVVLFDQA